MDEIIRIQGLLQVENELYELGYSAVTGVDEAGRGPLAGPVMAAACILPKVFDLPGLNDSKKLTEKKRVYLSQRIKEQAVAFALGSASAGEIDLINILKATHLAMKRALDNLAVSPDYILIDGRDKLNVTYQQRAIIGGDGLSASIAAASILAKVARDELMCEMHEVYPEYSFDQHKGYGTRLHIEALTRFGPCPIHRRSFAPVKDVLAENEIS